MQNSASNNTVTDLAVQNIEEHISTLANTAFNHAFETATRNGQSVTFVKGYQMVEQKSDGTQVTIHDFSVQRAKFYQPVTHRVFSRRQK